MKIVDFLNLCLLVYIKHNFVAAQRRSQCERDEVNLVHAIDNTVEIPFGFGDVVARTISSLTRILEEEQYVGSVEGGMSSTQHVRPVGVCWTSVCQDLKCNDITEDFIYEAEPSGVSSLTYALAGALKSETPRGDTPRVDGEYITILYSFTPNGVAQYPQDENFSRTVDCSNEISVLQWEIANYYRPLIVVTSREFKEYYEILFSVLSSKYEVLEYVDDSEALTNLLVNAIDNILCGEGCSISRLQMLFLVDLSYSYSMHQNSAHFNMGRLIQDFSLESNFPVEGAIAGFADKPERPVGDDGDFCYREILGFTRSVETFFSVMENQFYRLSGLDELESQLDAIKFSLISRSLGWSKLFTAGELKIIFLFTDSGPHEENDMVELGLSNYSNCATGDYPSYRELNWLLERMDSHLIVIPTLRVLDVWRNIVYNEFESLERVKVVPNVFGEVYEEGRHVVEEIMQRRCG